MNKVKSQTLERLFAGYRVVVIKDPLHIVFYTGWYIFIETSVPRRRGDKAWLQSAVYTATGPTPQCLNFWYNMYGRNIGGLTVYVFQNGSMPGNPIWSLTGNQGTGWKNGKVPITSSSQYTVWAHLILFIKGS